MAIIQVGSGSYTTILPPGEVGVTNFQGIPLTPLVSSDFTGAIPTNDWSSSILYPFFNDQYSAPMFAHPLNMKADAQGLNLGYTDTPTYFYDGGGREVKFQYTYHSDLNVGLRDMQAPNTVLQSASDWFVTAQWNDNNSASQMDATFGHGSSFVYFERADGNSDVVITPQAPDNNSNSIGQPNNTNTVFEISHVNGVYNGGQVAMNMLVNSIAGDGSETGNSIEARISIDTNGDGHFDYVKTINYFPLDGTSNTTEVYTQNESGRSSGASTNGQLQNLDNATIKVEMWQPFGTGKAQVLDTSNIQLPFNNLTDSNTGAAISNTLYLDTDNTGHGVLTSTVGTNQAMTLGETASESVVSWDGNGTIFYDGGNVIGITVNGNSYGLFAPVGSDWNLDNGVITSDLNGKDYFSTALLPDDSAQTLQYFYEHAFAFPTDSMITYSYDAAHAEVDTQFTITTDLKEAGFSDQALTNLYPHQWLNTNVSLTDYSYESPRGEMKLFEGNTFTTETPYTGILPSLPNFLDPAQSQQTANYVQAEYQNLQASNNPILFEDAYFSGKAIQKYGQLAELADQVGNHDAKTLFIHTMENELQDWFTATGTQGDKQLYYNDTWDTLQPYPASFFSNTELNDHHFQYGYFVNGAATIAKFDPAWVDQWGGMVDLIIRDVATTDRNDPMFTDLRNFDPYEGHSWASGHASFFSANNQESSSEALNFASGLTLWGAETGNAALQNLGQYLYATEVSAVQQYWFDINNINFPDDFDHSEVGMIWSDGANYSTWFSGDPEMIHGINYLPLTGGSMYLGLDPQYAAQNYQEMLQMNGGAPTEWKNIMLQYQAFFDPQAAVNALNGGYTSLNEPPFEMGESVAHNYSWIHNFNELGQVYSAVTADTPFFTVFNHDGLLTYTAYNPGDTALDVHFSNGMVMTLAANEFAAINENKSWSSITGLIDNTLPNPDPDPDPVIPPDPDPVVPPNPDPIPDDNSNGVRIEGNNIYGTVGNDVIQAGNTGLNIYGAQGNDVMHGGAGNDRIYGVNGTNILEGDGGTDFLNGGQGHNTYLYEDLADSTAANLDTIEQFKHGIDKLDLSALNINPNNVRISTISDSGTLTVDGNNFSIKFIAMSGGVITLSDINFNADAAPIVPEPTPTPDPIPDPTPTPTPTDNSNGVRVDGNNIYGTTGNDVINAGNSGFNIYGAQGNDVMHGGAGNDRIYGVNGTNILEGNGGADFLNGGQGHNTYLYESISDSTSAQQDIIEQFKHGIDKLDLSALNINPNNVHLVVINDSGTLTVDNNNFSIKFIAMTNGVISLNDINFNPDAAPIAPTPDPTPDPTPTPVDANVINGTAGDDFIPGTAGNDAMNGSGGNDQMHGIEGNDTMHGGNGDDHVYGNAGNDHLYGDAGNDYIFDNTGHNILNGGAGADHLIGGGDSTNVYVYEGLIDSSVDLRDTIEAFQHGEDQVDLTALNVNANDVHIQAHDGIQTLTVDNTNFAIDFIASDPISNDDILT